MKKGIIIFCLTVYIFSSFVITVKRAEAALPAAVVAGAAGVEIGVGAYVLGALAVGGLATTLGLQYGDEIKAHAQSVWQNAQQSIKDSLKASIQASVQAGSSVITLSSDVVDFLKTKISSMYHHLVNTVSSSSQAQVSYAWDHLDLRAPAGHLFITYSHYYQKYIYSEIVSYSRYGSSYGGKYQIVAENVNWTLTGMSAQAGGVVLNYFPHEQYVYPTSVFSVAPTLAQAVNFLSGRFGVLPVLVTSAKAADFANDYSKNKDVWSSQIDAVTSGAMSSGVYVPFDDIKAYPVDNAGTRVSDKPLTWNNGTKAWERAEGGTWTGAIDWDFPIPKTIEGGKVVVGEGAGATVVVGEGVGTNVNVGEGVGTGEGIISDILTAVRTIVGILTTGLVGDVSKINWDKLKMAGSVFTTAFPFSIPWDVGRAFDAVFGSFEDLRELPKWVWKVNFLGEVHNIEFKINSYFFSWFEIIRAVMLIMFDVGLIYAVRKMLGGAS